MSGSGRKRSSKWDSRDQAQFDDERIQDDGWSEKSGRSYYHREAGHGWQSPEVGGTNGSKWSTLESNDPRSKHDTAAPSKEPFSGSRGSHKNEKFDKEHNRYVEDSMAWEEDEDYGTRMSPGLDEWRQQSHSQSPKSGWNRRDRSRSRSRSRGRSRSPAHSLRRSRSGASTQLCKDFTAGRCRRGNNCPFLHDGDENYDDYWDNSRHRKGGSSKYSSMDTRDYTPKRPSVPCTDFVKGRCRRGALCRFEHHGASEEFVKGSEGGREKENERRKRDTSTERVVEHEFRRSSDIPCRFFAAGNCRNGNHCRFSHHTRGYSSPDRKLQDKWASGRKSDDVNPAWNGPKWNDKVVLSDAAKASDGKNGSVDRGSASWSMNDRLRNSVNNESATTTVDPAVSREATKINDKEALQWKTDGAGSMSLPGPRHGEKWIEDMDMSPDWNYAVPSSNVVKEEHGQIPRRSESFKDASVKTSKQGDAEEDSSRFNGTAGAAAQPPSVNAVPFFQAKPDLRDEISAAMPYDDKSAVRKAINISGNIMSTQSVNQNGQNTSVFHFSSTSTSTSTSTIEQSQTVIPSEHQALILGNLQNLLSTEGKSVIKPDFPPLTSGLSLSQKLVSGGEHPTLNNLSASLVHLLGNGQQLPQLYAALNPNDVTVNPAFLNTDGSNFPVSSSIPQLDPAIVHRHHYDPMQDSKESRPEIGNNTASAGGVLPNPVLKTIVSDGKPEVQLENSNPEAGGSTEESRQKRQHLTSPAKGKSELGTAENKKARGEENKKAQEADPSDGLEKEGANNDGKKNKDVKGIRAFKFALVEFVKELLKPTWKEGQINKDVYKTIVKKVVDKVTATVQGGGNIPQTQEKIDHYLSNSKEKLTKLVQAYVDKNQKT